MPLHVTIRLNRDHLTTLHVGRLSGGTRPDDINEYSAVYGPENETPDFFGPDAVTFTHRYGDGADICVLKALTALTGYDA
jgi:hypothetical protein